MSTTAERRQSVRPAHLLHSLGPVGQITTWATQYHQGLIDLDALIENVKGFEFKTPARFEDMPHDVFVADAQAEDRTYDDEDTFDEILHVRDRGLLSKDDLLAIVSAMESND